MRKTGILLGIVFLFCQANFCYARDWKSLHEEADKLSLSGAAAHLKEKTGNPEDLYVLGLIYLNAHKDKDAGAVFNKIMAQYPTMQEAGWGKAEVLRRQHRLAESENLLRECIKTNPDFSPAYISQAYIEYTRMNFNRAVQLAAWVIQQGSKNVDLSNYVRAYLILAGSKGMIAHYGGLLSKVINGAAVFPALRKAQKLQPDSPAVLFGLGSFYLLAPPNAGGNLDKALEYLEKTVQADALFSDAYVRLAQAYKIKGENGRYEAYMNKALGIDPQNVLALDIQSGECKFICIDKKE